MNLPGSVVIVTGASSGIGAATARELGRRGAQVVLAARREAELRTVVDAIVRDGGRTLAVPTDLAQREEIDRLVQTTLDQFGRIDVLINNAGINAGARLSDGDDAAIERIVNVNLLAPARCIQAVLPTMRQQRKGMIVNIGSVAGEIATSGLYAATKFGLRGLSDAMRRELRGQGIAIVLIAPGFVRTPMTTGVPLLMPSPEAVARVIVRSIEHPRRRIIYPWPYAPLAYLAKALPWAVDWIVGSNTYQHWDKDRKRRS